MNDIYCKGASVRGENEQARWVCLADLESLLYCSHKKKNSHNLLLTYRVARNFCRSLLLRIFGDVLCFAGTNFSDFQKVSVIQR